mgnify:CR=1 FL=1
MTKEIPIGLILSIINQIGTDGVQVDIAQTAEGQLAVTLGVAEVALRCGTADGILLDDIRVTVSGLDPADLKAPGPHLLEKLDIVVHHFAVRISRDWINGVIERGPFLAGTPISEVVLVFNEKNTHQIIVRGHAKGLPFETTLLIGLKNGNVVVAVDDVRVLGFLPVPAWLRNLVTNMINVADKVNRPGVTFKDGVTEVDVLQVIPVPIKMKMQRLETSGRFIIVEGGDV